jgi:hypothetical protein
MVPAPSVWFQFSSVCDDAAGTLDPTNAWVLLLCACVRRLFVAGIQGAVWGSLGAAVLFILLLNFLRQS